MAAAHAAVITAAVMPMDRTAVCSKKVVAQATVGGTADPRLAWSMGEGLCRVDGSREADA